MRNAHEALRRTAGRTPPAEGQRTPDRRQHPRPYPRPGLCPRPEKSPRAGLFSAQAIVRPSAATRSHRIDLVMTRQDIADYLGLTIETVSRAFGKTETGGNDRYLLCPHGGNTRYGSGGRTGAGGLKPAEHSRRSVVPSARKKRGSRLLHHL